MVSPIVLPHKQAYCKNEKAHAYTDKLLSENSLPSWKKEVQHPVFTHTHTHSHTHTNTLQPRKASMLGPTGPIANSSWQRQRHERAWEILDIHTSQEEEKVMTYWVPLNFSRSESDLRATAVTRGARYQLCLRLYLLTSLSITAFRH